MIVNKQLAKNYKNRLNWVVVTVRQIWRVFLEPQYIIDRWNGPISLHAVVSGSWGLTYKPCLGLCTVAKRAYSYHR